MGKTLTAGGCPGPGLVRRCCNVALLFMLSMLCSYVAVAAVVSMQQPNTGGGEVHIPVVLHGEGDETLAGLQFDLRFDPDHFELVEVASGAAAHDAGKEVVLSSPVPGTGRVLITGFNDSALYDGHVATVVLRPRGPIDGLHALTVDRMLATDPAGNSVGLAYEDLYAFPPAAPPEKAEAREVAVAEETTAEIAADQQGEPGSPAAAEDTAPVDSGAPPGSSEASRDALAVAGNGLGENDPSIRESGARASQQVSLTGAAPLTSREGHPATSQAGTGSRASSPRAIVYRERPTQPGVAQSRAPLSLPEGREAGMGQTGPGHRNTAEQDTGETTRLAFATPITNPLAPPGAAAATGSSPAVRPAAPEFSGGATAVAAVLGLALFGVLLALRAVVLDRALHARRRRTP